MSPLYQSNNATLQILKVTISLIQLGTFSDIITTLVLRFNRDINIPHITHISRSLQSSTLTKSPGC